MHEPCHFRGNGFAVFERFGETRTDVLGAADAVEKRGLQESGDAEGGGDEYYTEGGVRTDKEVLFEKLSARE